MAAVALRCRRWLDGWMLALVLAACAGPAPPLMSPFQATRNYGYSDEPLGEGRYRITYVGPYQRTLRGPSAENAANAGASTRAVDFAMWRAAQLATAQDYAGFSASNIQSGIDTVVADYYDPSFGPWHGPSFGPGSFPWGPTFAGPYWDWAPDPYAYARATATIDVELKRDPRAGDYDARDVVEQLRQHYPSAESSAVEHGAVPAMPPSAALSGG